MLSSFADILGIISFFINIVLLVYSESMRKQIKRQKKDYIKEQQNIRIVLMGHRDSIWQDNLLTLQIRSTIRTSLITYRHNYRYVLSLMDRIRISNTIKILSKKPEDIDVEELCSNLDYLIARFGKKE